MTRFALEPIHPLTYALTIAALLVVLAGCVR